MAKICDNCACYEVCIYANPNRTIDCTLWKPCMEWIPVTERMPEKQEKVLVCGRCGGIYVAYRHEYGWRRVNSKHYSCNPTHWMPLPEPPKEE